MALDTPMAERDGRLSEERRVEISVTDPMTKTLGPELATWAAEMTERVRELRMEADQLEQESDLAFAAARGLMAGRPGRPPAWMNGG